MNDIITFQEADGHRIKMPKSELTGDCVLLKDAKTGDEFFVDISQIDINNLCDSKPTQSLSAQQIQRIDGFAKLLQPFYPYPTMEWLDDLSRESCPDSEIAIWEDIACACVEAAKLFPELTPQAKAEVFRIALAVSNTGDPALALSMVNPVVLHPSQALMTMRCFAIARNARKASQPKAMPSDGPQPKKAAKKPRKASKSKPSVKKGKS